MWIMWKTYPPRLWITTRTSVLNVDNVDNVENLSTTIVDNYL